MLRNRTQLPSRAAADFRFGVVVARYNQPYTDSMLAATLDTLTKSGARPEQIRVERVPGSFEIPVVVARLAASGKFDVLIALGVILRGQTAHADLIATAITHRLSEIAIQRCVPVIHEVLLLDNIGQAKARCLDKKMNRGIEAARTAIEMAHVLRTLTRE